MRLKITFNKNRITKTDFKQVLKGINKQIEEKGIILHADKKEIYTTLKNKNSRHAIVYGNKRQLYYYLLGMNDLIFSILNIS